MWFHLLSKYFEYPEYVIAPEFHSTTSIGKRSRFDLAVYNVQQQQVVFIYEGKKPDLTEGQVQELLGQAFGYIRENRPAFAMYGTGDRVSFFANVGSSHMWRLTDYSNLTKINEKLGSYYQVGDKRGPGNIDKFLRNTKKEVQVSNEQGTKANTRDAYLGLRLESTYKLMKKLSRTLRSTVYRSKMREEYARSRS